MGAHHAKGPLVEIARLGDTPGVLRGCIIRDPRLRKRAPEHTLAHPVLRSCKILKRQKRHGRRNFESLSISKSPTS